MPAMPETPAIEKVTSGLQFPEGPIAMPDGTVVLTEIRRGTLTRVHPDGTQEVVAETGGGPNGAAIGPDGAIYVTNNGGFFEWNEIGDWTIPGETPAAWTGGCLQRVDPATGSVEVLADECQGQRLRAPNDLVFDTDGGIWFTDHGVTADHHQTYAGVLYRSPDGTVSPVAFHTESTNGIGLSPAGDRLYVAETHTGKVWAWDVTGPGEVGRHPDSPAAHGGTLLFDAPAGHLFDSLAVDGDGWVCVGTLGPGVGGVTAVAPDGSASEHLLVPDEVLVTNICFGGDDLRTAYLTSSGRGELLKVAWPRPGLALAYPRGDGGHGEAERG
jgi:gluconolactonase